MLKHCLALKTIILNFVAFFVGIVRNCNILNWKDVVLGHLSKTGVYAGHCFIIHLPGGGQCPLVRDSEPIKLLEIPTSPSLYILINVIQDSLPSNLSTINVIQDSLASNLSTS